MRKTIGDKAAFMAGWEYGHYDGGEHDCHMFEPTAERAWELYRRVGPVQRPEGWKGSTIAFRRTEASDE